MKKDYIVLFYGKIICLNKFIDEYDALVWALQNGYAHLKVINKIGDKRIVLNNGVKVEKLK